MLPAGRTLPKFWACRQLQGAPHTAAAPAWHSQSAQAGALPVQAVRAFTLPPAAAAAHVSALHQLSSAGGDGAWAAGLQADCEEHLGRFVDAASRGAAAEDPAKAEWQACTAAFTAGEASSNHTPHESCLRLPLAPPTDSDGHRPC